MILRKENVILREDNRSKIAELKVQGYEEVKEQPKPRKKDEKKEGK